MVDAFQLDSNQINPSSVPTRLLANGAVIPVIGLGTFGSDKYNASQISEAVAYAISIGYRHIDCASVYGNEKEIGETFSKVLGSGAIKREDLWVTSKVWNDMHGDGDVIASCKHTLADLQLEYLDLYLVHWPFPNYHAPGCDVASRSPDAKPYIHENYMKTWRQMEQLVTMGLVKNIGTSNMTIPKLNLLLRDAKIMPVVNEMEIHPHFQQAELYNYCLDNNIMPIGFSPIGSPSRPDRDRSSDDTVDIEDPAIVAIAKAHNIHPAIVCIKWAVQLGHVAIPFAVSKRHIDNNLLCVTQDPLTQDEMASISKIDKNCRLIKGQVFLWKEGQTWEALWDLDGRIAD